MLCFFCTCTYNTSLCPKLLAGMLFVHNNNLVSARELFLMFKLWCGYDSVENKLGAC